MTKFLDEFDCEPEYMPYPKFMKKSTLSHPARLIYTMFLDRYKLSKMNNWRDDEGHIYIVYPIEHVSADSGMSDSTVRRAIEELKQAQLIITRRHGFSTPNRIYVKVPDDAKMTKPASVRRDSKIHFENERKGGWEDWVDLHQKNNAAPPEAERTDCPETESVQECTMSAHERTEQSGMNTVTVREEALTPSADEQSVCPEMNTHSAHERTPNKIIPNNINSNHIISNNKRAYGKFENVFLTEADYERIRREHVTEFDEILLFLSEYFHDCPEVAEKPENADHADCLLRLFG
ncbi:MAG: replication initiator protein A [Clostridia bacterium]|nr:replication initiator protein A [Clostridia bacterium]MBQ8512586.1 replication initiator protein A [Clostridia bacterium]